MSTSLRLAALPFVLLAVAATNACGGTSIDNGIARDSGTLDGATGDGGGPGSDGGAGDTGPACTDVIQGPRAFCALTQAQPGSNLTITLRLDCAGSAPRNERCVVNVTGNAIRLQMLSTACTNDGPQPPVCRVADVACAIPPLAPGSYTVTVSQPGDARLAPREPDARGNLIVVPGGTQTACTLPPLGSKPPTLSLADYSADCDVDADCAAVSTDVCCNACENGAVASTAVAKFNADLADKARSCVRGGFESCACAPGFPSCGVNKKCQLLRR